MMSYDIDTPRNVYSPHGGQGSMVNAISVDLEDWFCVNNMRDSISFEQWDSMDQRASRNTQILLDLFQDHDVTATFFVLGWLAERSPGLIKEIAARGHEIACHGYAHRLITEMTPDEFRADLKRATDALSKCGVERPVGFRAPSFSVTKATLWAVEVLEEEGFLYDSSVYPIGFHPDYGMADSPLEIHRIGQTLIEFPLCCIEVVGRRIPCSGGAYFRLLPYLLTKELLKKCNRDGRPFVFYFHPWEIDPDQPCIAMPLGKRLRHYTNLKSNMGRLRRLVENFKFASVRQVLGI